MQREQFEHLALEHFDAVYRMALQLARHPDDAWDLVQETYLKALRVAEGFEEQGGGIRPWLFKILHNVFYTSIEKARRRPSGSDALADVAEAPGDGPGEPEPAWDLATFDWDQIDQRLKAAIDALKPEYRSVLLLWGVEGLKYREIADVQGVPIGTVMSRLHRARAILMEQLANLAEEKRLGSG